jgi:hypothetical protein
MKKWDMVDGGHSRFHALPAKRDREARRDKTSLFPRESDLERMNQFSRACVEGGQYLRSPT